MNPLPDNRRHNHAACLFWPHGTGIGTSALALLVQRLCTDVRRVRRSANDGPAPAVGPIEAPELRAQGEARHLHVPERRRPRTSICFDYKPLSKDARQGNPGRIIGNKRFTRYRQPEGQAGPVINIQVRAAR